MRALLFYALLIFLCLSCSGGDDSADDGSDGASDDDTADDDDNDDNDDNDSSDDDDDDDSIDPEGDEDRDGITNGQEEIDGTDPFDPSDALAWHPELADYPWLLGDANHWQDVKAAVLSKDAEAAFLFNKISTVAGYTPTTQPAGSYNFSTTDYNAFIAASATVVAYINSDPAMADKAVDIIAGLDVDFRHLPFDQYDQGSIHGAQALLNACIAYDLLKGLDLIAASQAIAMEEAIYDFAGDLYFLYVTLPFGWFYMNNHVIKLAAALVVCGMTLNDNPKAAVYVNYGLTTAPFFLLDFQTPNGGGHGEGPHYFDYSLKTWLPFVFIYNRFAKGVTYPYRIDCRPRFFLPCDKVNTDVVDPLIDPRTESLLDWRISLTMPDGRIPPIDDAFTSCGRSGALAPVYDRADFAWHYFESEDCQRQETGIEILQLTLWDQMPTPTAPDMGSVCNEEAGQAIFRNDWTAESHYALINGEHGKARLAGLGHEHPDATSFIFSAYGDMLAIDSSYQSYSERMLVAPAENHNLILVDGQGPTIGLTIGFVGVDSYLSDFIDEPPFRSVKVESSYRQADIIRWVMLIDDDYFITTEIVESSGTHAYGWLLHANAGGTTDGDFTLEADGATIERPNVMMRSYLQSDPAGLVFSEYEEEHGFVDGDPVQWHAVMKGEVQTDRARFLSVHLTSQPADEPAEVGGYAQADVMAYFIEGSDYFDAIITNDGAGFVLAEASGAPGQIESDGSFVWLRTNPATGELIDSKGFDGTYLTYNGKMGETLKRPLQRAFHAVPHFSQSVEVERKATEE